MATAEVATEARAVDEGVPLPPDTGEPPKGEAPPEQPKAEPAKETPKKGHVGFSATGIQLNTLAELYRFAEIIFASRMVPKALDSVEKVVIAIQFGAEFRVPAMASVRSVVVVNGTPSWKGDMALALVRSSGKCALYRAWHEGQGESRKALVLSQRADESEPMLTEFSYHAAVLAKLWGKTGNNGQDTPWITYPDRMLHYRALGFNLRDNFPDVMMGTAIAEELADIPVTDVTPISATSTRRALAAAPPPDPLLASIGVVQATKAAPDPALVEAVKASLDQKEAPADFVLVDPAKPAVTPSVSGKTRIDPKDCSHPDMPPSRIPAGKTRVCPDCLAELQGDPIPRKRK